jgi:hypothetical protein
MKKDNLMDTEQKAKAKQLLKHLDKKRGSIRLTDYQPDNGTLFDVDGEEWLVCTDSEADETAKVYIKDSLWAFNASFILCECGLDSSGEDSLKAMQEKSCESANDFIKSLVEKTCGLDSFVESAISADGRGHFLSSYDGEEVELGEYFGYRTN